MNIENKRILVTGGESMLGGEICDILEKNGNIIDHCPHSEINLLDLRQVQYRFEKFQPNLVVHAATYSGNVQFNQKYPYNTFWNTTQIALNVIECCTTFKIEKVMSILSSCAYPNIDDHEIREDELWDGPCHPSIASHGLAKRNIQSLMDFANAQYGLNGICCVVSNSFGPRDSFDIEKTKVVGGMIKRFVEAKEKNLPFVECWGTGKPLRELLYSKDAAKLLIRALEVYDGYSSLNIGTPFEKTIRQLADSIARAVGYVGEIRWLKEKGDGQKRKKLNISKMNSTLFNDWKFYYTNFSDAIQETVLWYINNKEIWAK